MRQHKVLLSLLACLVLLCALVACGGTTSSQTGTQTTEGFTGHAARDKSELEAIVEKATKTADERLGKEDEKAEESKADDKTKEEDKAKEDEKAEESKTKESKNEESDEIEKTADAFSSANDEYRKGNYDKAESSYESIIGTHAKNYGANVNLVLALLQQGKNDEALEQALACVRIFESDEGTLLNAQVAGAACGFSASDVEEAITDMYTSTKNGSSPSSKIKDSNNKQYYSYNKLWSDIETELHDDPSKSVYDGLKDSLEKIKKKLTDDEDVEHLEAYLDAVGVALGLDGASSENAESTSK